MHRQCTAFMDVIRSGKEFCEFGRSQRFAAGQVVYDYGDAPNHLYLVKAGVVRTSVLSSAGKELVTGVWGAGEVFGQFFSASGGSAPSAPLWSRRRSWSDWEWRSSSSWCPGVEGALAMLQLFCHRISALEEKVAELAFANVRTAFRGLLLLRLAKDGVAHPDGSVLCEDYPTHEEMARHIGTTREQVTSILAQFRRSGAVDYRRTGPIRVFPERLEQQIEAP